MMRSKFVKGVILFISEFENRVFCPKGIPNNRTSPRPFLSPLSPLCFLLLCFATKESEGEKFPFKGVGEECKLFLPIMIAVILIKVEKDVFFSDFNSEKDFSIVDLCFK